MDFTRKGVVPVFFMVESGPSLLISFVSTWKSDKRKASFFPKGKEGSRTALFPLHFILNMLDGTGQILPGYLNIGFTQSSSQSLAFLLRTI